MGWPQVALISWLAVGVGIYVARHGQPVVGNYHAGTALVRVAIIVGLLWAGGFWSAYP